LENIDTDAHINTKNKDYLYIGNENIDKQLNNEFDNFARNENLYNNNEYCLNTLFALIVV